MEYLICTWALTYFKIVLTFAIWSWFCITYARAMSGASSYRMSLSLSGAVFLFLQISGYLNLLANTIDNFTHGLAVAASFLVSRKVRFLSPAVYWSGDVCSQVWCNMQKNQRYEEFPPIFWKFLRKWRLYWKVILSWPSDSKFLQTWDLSLPHLLAFWEGLAHLRF